MLLWTQAMGPYETNCYILACPQTRKAAIIDPGQPDPWIRATVEAERLEVEVILLTHGHLDHIGGVEDCRTHFGVPVAIHEGDVPWLTDPNRNGSAWSRRPIQARAPERLLHEGDEVVIGSLRLQVIHTPGHTPGGIGLYVPGHLIGGDTLFAGSIGRTDFPGGDHAALIRAIRTRLFALPAETVVYPGHGPETTIGDERQYNPFVGLGDG